MFFALDNRWWYQKKAYRLLLDIQCDAGIDVVLSFNDPIEAHIAADKFCKQHPQTRWISYWADLFACKEYKKNVFISMNRMRKMEYDLLNRSDAILGTQEVIKELQERYDDLQVKMIGVPYVIDSNILKQSYDAEVVVSENINFAYMGSFYKDFRNPVDLLEVFSMAPANYILHLFSGGECQEMVDKYVKENKNIIYRGFVDKKILEKALSEMHILINIENDDIVAKPSKVYELLAYRKPIIDFCKDKKDFAVFENTPNALMLLKGAKTSIQLDKISHFVSTRANHITREMVENNYPMNLEPYVSNLVRRVIDVES